MVRHARAAQKPDPRFGPARKAFIESMLRHLHPDGRHILRRSRPDETLFVPDGPGDLRQYRAVLTMCDGGVIVDHPRLRTSDVDLVPTGDDPAADLAYVDGHGLIASRRATAITVGHCGRASVSPWRGSPPLGQTHS